jgi:hypothetical protein
MTKTVYRIGARARVRTDHFVDLEAGDDIVTIPEESCFTPDDVSSVRYRRLEDGTMRVAWLCLDDNGGDYWQDRDGGEWVEIDPRRVYDGEADAREVIDALIAEHGAALVFPVAYTDHGPVCDYRPMLNLEDNGPTTLRFEDFDHASYVYVCPADATNPVDYAVAVLREYTDWANGSVYGVITREIDGDGNVSAREECWGFIGFEYAESERDAYVAGGAA